MDDVVRITTIEQPKWYKVDWDRIDFNGVIRVLRALDPKFSSGHKQFNNIEDLLIEDETQAYYHNTTENVDDNHN